MIVPIFVIGLISSIIVEVLKLFPWLSVTDNRKRVLAFFVSIGFSLIYVFTTAELAGTEIFTLIFGSIGAAFLIYKSVIQTVSEPVRMRLKKDAKLPEEKPQA